MDFISIPVISDVNGQSALSSTKNANNKEVVEAARDNGPDLTPGQSGYGNYDLYFNYSYYNRYNT